MTRKNSSFRPGFENLENRCVPAVFAPQLADAVRMPELPLSQGLRVGEIVLQKVHGEQFRIDGSRLHVHPALPSASHFPLPADRTGDVRNLDSAPGGNDSSWIDLDAPLFANHLNLNERALNEVFGPHDAEDRVLRFNLIELLVQRTGETQIHFSEEINPPGGQAFRQLKAIGDMNEKLRTANTPLRRNLAADHFDGARRLGGVSSPLNSDAVDPPVLRAVNPSPSKNGVRRV